MNVPDHVREKLGYNIIHDRLNEFCVSELGKIRAERVQFSTDHIEIQAWLDQVAELLQIILEGNLPPLGSVNDITDILARARVAGNWITGDELHKILTNLTVTRELSAFIFSHSDQDSSLSSFRVGFDELKPLELRLSKTVDEDGHVLDGASSELKSIRRKIRVEEGVLRKKINSVYRQAKTDGFIPEGSTVSVRDGRMVIPVKAANKRQLQGFVHDESANGNIVFMEPAVVLEANNVIRELQIAEAREIHRILLEITGIIAQQLEQLTESTLYLGELDFLVARAKLARSLEATRPRIDDEQMLLKNLRHPLLLLVSREDDREVVAHSLELNREKHILLISGPNAGGKSVAMKSVGLNQLMLQSGLLPCADPDATFRVFDRIFVDIGDEQSIDNDLSTYSSHLKNMVRMIRHAGPTSLVLIDEFGSGTDPAFGGAIAEAVLARLTSLEVYGVITTHFSNLKLFADNTRGLINGAMLFDLKELRPLYELEVGRPGSSFSLEVAAKSGLPKAVINQAEAGVGANQIEIENLLTRLEDEKRRFEQQNKKLAARDEELNQLKDEYSNLKKKLENKQKEIINLARQEASLILSRTNKEIEKTIRHIKENKAEKKETKRVRESLEKFAGKIKPQETQFVEPTGVETEKGMVKVGDQALLKEKNVTVEVKEVKGKKAKVLIGELQSVVPLKSLVKISRREAKRLSSASSKASGNSAVNQLLVQYNPVLDVRGTRAIDLFGVLQKFIDESIMLGQQSVKVIHGKGNGVLRDLVRQELRQWSQVERFENEHVERGGDGATVIYFK